MKQQILLPGHGKSYEWSKDHVLVKASVDLTDGRLTLVEDALKPGFALARHYHKKMTEIFYILDGEVTFNFDDQKVVASRGMTVNIPPMVNHEVVAEKGARLITVFSPGGFDRDLKEMSAMTEAQFADAALMQSLSEKYDIWMTPA